MPFQELCEAFIQTNDLLDMHLRCLNKQHHPGRNLPGLCWCRGQFTLVTYLGIETGRATEGFNVLGKQHVRVRAFFFLLSPLLTGRYTKQCLSCEVVIDVRQSGFAHHILMQDELIL